MWRRTAVALLIAMLTGSTSVSAFRYHIRTYDEGDGLPNQAVFGIDQSPDGRIWLATRQGLVVYDGSTWTKAMPAFVNVGSGLRDVIIDESGRAWIANLMTPAQVSWYEDEMWHHLPPPPVQSWGWDVAQFDVATATDGTIWVALATSDRRLVLWDGRSWTVHDGGSEIGVVHAIGHRDGSFLLATEEGLWTLPLEVDADPQPYPGWDWRPCYGLATDPSGGLWVVQERAVVSCGPEGCEEVLDFARLGMAPINFGVPVAVAPRGGFYIGTPWDVVYLSRDGGIERLDRDSGLATEGATDIFVDREGNVWVGAMRGLSKIVSRQLRTFDHNHGLMDDEVSAILRLRSGSMLLGHEHGLTVLDDPPRPLRFDVTPNLRSRFMDLAEDDDGTIWAAMDRHGLARIKTGQNPTWQQVPTGFAGAIHTLVIDSEGTLWVGGVGGVGRFVDGRCEKVPLPISNPDVDVFVRRLSLASDGGVFIMTGRHGVFHLSRGVSRSWDTADAPGGLSTYCVLERPDGATWIGTAVGVRQLRDGKIAPVRDLAPILRRPVYAMQTDRTGRVWFGTDEGVRIWDGEIMTCVTVGDGLAGSEINRDGLWLDHDGSMWVGTDAGVTRFEADYLADSRAAPLIKFLGFDVDGVRIPDHGPVTMRGPVSLLVAHFRGISLVDEERVRYRTWLDGFEADWQPLTTVPMRQLRYTNLAPGDYRFYVQAVGMHGEESSIAVSERLRVVPPIWRTWWFLLASAFLAVAMVAVVVALVVGRRNARRLESLVGERTVRLNDLEQEARADSARMSTTLQSISDGVLAVDGDEKLVLANRAAAAMLGEDPDRLVGRRLSELLPALSGIEGTTHAPVVARHDCLGSTEVDIEATIAPLGMSMGATVGKVIALRDITDRRRFEEEIARAQRLESLGVFAGGIAHDFNNLLAVILGHTSLLELTDLSASNRDKVSRIRLSSEKARALTQQMLTFARGGEPRREPTLLGPLIDDTVNLAMSGANARCRCEIDPGLRPAMIDADQVGQALSNLLINAWQAMPEGGEITIVGRNLKAAPEWLEPGNYVELIISDQGPGLLPEERERIFEPFYTTKATGNGLGLAVAYSVARRHGGVLTAGVASGGGAAFTLILPATDESKAKAGIAADSANPRRGRILVMDDDDAVRGAIIQMLDFLRSDAVGVADGARALAAWSEARDAGRPFDLAILDLTVPGALGGRETLRELQAMDPEVLALVASGYSNDEVLADPTAFGFAGAIVKPFDTATLARAVQGVLGPTV